MTNSNLIFVNYYYTMMIEIYNIEKIYVKKEHLIKENQ